MSTITIRLPEDLKARIAQAAKTVGATSHNSILEAIAEKAALAEQRFDFNAVADQRYAQVWCPVKAFHGRTRGRTSNSGLPESA